MKEKLYNFKMKIYKMNKLIILVIIRIILIKINGTVQIIKVNKLNSKMNNNTNSNKIVVSTVKTKK